MIADIWEGQKVWEYLQSIVRITPYKASHVIVSLNEKIGNDAELFNSSKTIAQNFLSMIEGKVLISYTLLSRST
jgi:hypothetical protein